MSREGRALDNPINWSFGVGRLFGIRLRVHLFFLLGAVYLVVQAAGDDGPGVVHGLGWFAILFFMVLLHEFGHCFAARAVGGHADEILMWPLGGLASVDVPHTPRANFITTAAGPAVNLVICLLAAAALIVMTGSGWAVPWNPFLFTVTHVPITSELQWWLVVTFALSYMLLLFNLAPVFPFDGGRMFQCLVWPAKGF
ncbi:MAG TPA: site-2 protease family protein, partial [Phycisphaerae bacterium]|nr:site-2 protease family protein [Phycisphaerae bacterium]